MISTKVETGWHTTEHYKLGIPKPFTKHDLPKSVLTTLVQQRKLQWNTIG